MEELIRLSDAKTCYTKAASMYCSRYDLDEHNERILEMVFAYLDRDPEFNRQAKYGMFDLSKGLMLLGNPGSGKTTILEIMQAILRKTPMGFVKKATTEIVDQFAKDGPEYLKNLTGNIFFDDLGFENPAVHYGDKRELMKDVIFARYDQMRYTGAISHFTSMSTPEALQTRYGPFAWSRLCQMCNVMFLGAGKSKDRRETSLVIQRPNMNTMPRLWITKAEYDEAQELQKIREYYKRESEKPYEPAKPKGSGTRMREYLDHALGGDGI
jgi:energy-coupling factor transporter ATP-binding protein EcfA2